MRKYIYYLGILPFFLVTLSCDSLLDKVPYDAVSDDSFWRTEKDLDAAVASIYRTMVPNDNLLEFGLLDAITDIAATRTVAGFNPISAGVYNSNHGAVATRWTTAYRGIVRANDVLKNVDGMDVEESLKKERKGEALFLRSWFYFNLVYFFGDVPLILDVPTMDDADMSRTEKATVVEQMLADLENATELLNIVPSSVGRATQGAALTLMGKIYMQESRFAEAIPVLERVLGLGYSLFPNYRELFMVGAENNAEVIFDIQYSSNTGKGLGNRFNTLFGNQSLKDIGWSWLLPTKELVELYETYPEGTPDPNPLYDRKDPRMDMTIFRPGATFMDRNDQVRNYPSQVVNYAHAQTGLHCRKNVIEGSSPDADWSANWDAPNNWILFRYADVLLLYAEALIETGSLDQRVYDAINEVRSRDNVKMPSISPGKSQAELREIVRRERGVELALEGWRFFDLMRWGLLKEVNNGKRVTHVTTGNLVVTRIFDDKHLLWPIPLGELDRNPNLKPQNPGW